MKTAIFIYATPADMARGYRALGTAQEFVEAGDEVAIVYDGTGVETLAAYTDDEHQLHKMYEGLKSHIDGACGFCAKSHGVKDTLEAAGIAMLSDHKGHASVRKYVADGYQLLIF